MRRPSLTSCRIRFVLPSDARRDAVASWRGVAAAEVEAEAPWGVHADVAYALGEMVKDAVVNPEGEKREGEKRGEECAWGAASM